MNGHDRGCGCDRCVHTRGMKRRWKIKRDLYGLQTVPPGRVVAHVGLVRSRGVTVDEIAARAGVARSTVARVLRGERLYRSTEAKILAVPVPAAPASTGRAYSGTSTVGARRRLQALATLGWSCQALADRAGVSYHTLRTVYHRDQVMTPTDVMVRELYDRFWAFPAPASKSSATTVANARRQGWVGPLAWDDDEIDDPAASPHGMTVGDLGCGWRARVRVEDIEEVLTVAPVTTTRELAARFGVHPSSIQQHLARKGRRDLLDRLNRNALVVTGRGRREPAA